MTGPAEPIHVLHVDDDRDFAELVATYLEREDDRITVSTEYDGRDAFDRLRDGDLDCVVSDYNMEGWNGLEFLEAVREECPDFPFVLFTGRGSEEIASEAISAGVTDYLQKTGGTEQYELLANRIGNAVEQYRAERTAAESERRLLEIAENTDDVLWMFTHDWSELLFVDSAYEEVFGRPREALAERPSDFLNAVHDEDRPRVEAVMEDLSGGESIDVEYRITTTDEAPRWVRVQGYPILDDAEEVVRVVGFARDVTDRKSHEHRLRTLHRTTRRLIRADSRQEVADVGTDAARDVLGLSINTVCLFEDDRDALVTASTTPEADELFENHPTFERGEGLAWEVYETRELRTFEDVSSSPDAYNPDTVIRSELILPLGDHGVFMAGSTTAGEFGEQTVTLARILAANVEAALDRTYQDRRIRTRERKIQQLQQHTQEFMRASSKREVARIGVTAAEEALDLPLSGIHLLDDDGETLEPVAVTDGVSEHLGTPPTYERSSPAGSAGSVNWDAFERGETIVVEDVVEDDRFSGVTTPSRSGIIHPLDDHGVFITSSAEPHSFDETDTAMTKILATMVAAALDRVEREDSLRDRTESLENENQRLEEFASFVSHDLRNPLNVAEGRLDLAREERDSDHLDAVARSHDRMRTLIDDLLALARDGSAITDAGRVDLAGSVEACWRNVETDDGTLVVETAGTVWADEARFQQLLENLVRNSIEHAGTGVTIRVGDLADGFYVEDDGPGIPEAEREAVFETGYSTVGDGTGYGLSIVERIAEEHGWDVGVTDGSDGGVRFEVTGVGRPDG